MDRVIHSQFIFDLFITYSPSITTFYFTGSFSRTPVVTQFDTVLFLIHKYEGPVKTELLKLMFMYSESLYWLRFNYYQERSLTYIYKNEKIESRKL